MLLQQDNSPRPRLRHALVAGFRVSMVKIGGIRSAFRIATTARVLLHPRLLLRLAREGYYLDLSGPTRRDPFHFFSGRHYLLRPLSDRRRMRAYLRHREFEKSRRTEEYIDLVYRGAGLLLWSSDAAGVDVQIRLEQTTEHVRHEGELSVVLRVDGHACAVVSFSYVPEDVMTTARAATPSATALFIGRNQSVPGAGRDRFARALPNDSAQMYVLAALSGIALADGFERVHAVHEAAQPAYRVDLDEGFRRSYSAVWERMPAASTAASYVSFAAEFPPTANAPVTASNRTRARRRRRTWDEIRESSRGAAQAEHCALRFDT